MLSPGVLDAVIKCPSPMCFVHPHGIYMNNLLNWPWGDFFSCTHIELFRDNRLWDRMNTWRHSFLHGIPRLILSCGTQSWQWCICQDHWGWTCVSVLAQLPTTTKKMHVCCSSKLWSRPKLLVWIDLFMHFVFVVVVVFLFIHSNSHIAVKAIFATHMNAMYNDCDLVMELCEHQLACIFGLLKARREARLRLHIPQCCFNCHDLHHVVSHIVAMQHL